MSVVQERQGEEELEIDGGEVIEQQHGILAISNESIHDFGPHLSSALFDAEEVYDNFSKLAENGDSHGPKRKEPSSTWLK